MYGMMSPIFGTKTNYNNCIIPTKFYPYISHSHRYIWCKVDRGDINQAWYMKLDRRYVPFLSMLKSYGKQPTHKIFLILRLSDHLILDYIYRTLTYCLISLIRETLAPVWI